MILFPNLHLKYRIQELIQQIYQLVLQKILKRKVIHSFKNKLTTEQI